ncbi:hypothetical protein V6N00_11000 [Tersicoccus sp. MR15.9]
MTTAPRTRAASLAASIGSSIRRLSAAVIPILIADTIPDTIRTERMP